MRLRLHIGFSFVAHAAIITTAFALIGRDLISFVPVDSLRVSLVSELSEIKVSHAIHQKKQAVHSPASRTRDTAVSGSYDHVTSATDKTASETGRNEGQTFSSAREDNPEERSPKESWEVTVRPPGLLHPQGVPSFSHTAGYQSSPVGIETSGELIHDQANTQSKDGNKDVIVAIRKAIEKALVYPLFAKKRGWRGTALTEFTVNAGGYPEDIRIVKSSGYNILDTAAKESLIKAAPFAAGKGRYEIPITFRLKND